MMRQEKINDCLQLVRLSSRKLNLIRNGKNEGKDHRLLKTKVCLRFIDVGTDFLTECIIDKIGTRCDILVPELFLVIEIVDTESDESLKRKREKYESVGLKMLFLRTGNVLTRKVYNL